mmetsp:Transcript_14651/g.41765  ORF Transcript_14651/g.41765 Transcript_14651/m.41765 type:complete len:357 (+) Transcript_14651:611-1681(+)
MPPKPVQVTRARLVLPRQVHPPRKSAKVTLDASQNHVRRGRYHVPGPVQDLFRQLVRLPPAVPSQQPKLARLQLPTHHQLRRTLHPARIHPRDNLHGALHSTRAVKHVEQIPSHRAPDEERELPQRLADMILQAKVGHLQRRRHVQHQATRPDLVVVLRQQHDRVGKHAQVGPLGHQQTAPLRMRDGVGPHRGVLAPLTRPTIRATSVQVLPQRLAHVTHPKQPSKSIITITITITIAIAIYPAKPSHAAAMLRRHHHRSERAPILEVAVRARLVVEKYVLLLGHVVLLREGRADDRRDVPLGPPKKRPLGSRTDHGRRAKSTHARLKANHINTINSINNPGDEEPYTPTLEPCTT